MAETVLHYPLRFNPGVVLRLVSLVAALLGWRTLDMVAWTRREVVAAKIGLGVLCLVLAAAIWMPV